MKYPHLSAQYAFVRGRQLEGTFPGNPKTGTWPITTLRIHRGCGAVPEEAWPYDTSVWPPPEPPGLDAIAKNDRDYRYQRVRTMLECKTVLAHMQLLVMVSVDITDRWYDAPNGRIPPLLPTDPSVGSHTVLLIGYDDLKAEFKFQNSWGVNWGDRGFGYIPYEVFRATWVEGWLEDFVGDEVWSKQESGVVERSWGVKEHGGGVFHCREFVGPGEERIGWAFAVERAGVIEVEELFVMPQFRGKGYGTKLIRLMGKLATDRGAPLRIWISHADNTPENLAAVENLVRQLGLRVVTSRVRWASHIASAALAASRFG